MRLPRDVGGEELARILGRKYGYEAVRQTGSHMRLSKTMGKEHHHPPS
jgi:predicted RNA binding protein YcfA (HicA-like mRNA interferase family)